MGEGVGPVSPTTFSSAALCTVVSTIGIEETQESCRERTLEIGS
jgi:hypothetical protein